MSARYSILIAAVFGFGVEAAITTISNVHPRFDSTGKLFDAHDGATLQFEIGGSFYYYAMGYGKCIENGKGADGDCGQLSNNTLSVWRSATLASGSWEQLHSFTPSSSGWPSCTYYRSQLLRSKSTGRYVLWLNAQSGGDNDCNACPQGSFAKCFAAGTSASPEGPFTFEGMVSGINYVTEGGVGDYALFQDDDADRTSYVIYKRSGRAPGDNAHRMTLQRLEPDLLAGDTSVHAGAGIFGAPFVEAPTMFKRGGVYYALFGQCCAFCAHGAGIGVYSAPRPLGPWTSHGNVGCSDDVPDTCGCALPVPAVYNTTMCPKGIGAVTFAQQNSVIVVGDDFVWTGDRWQSACASTVESQGLPATGLPTELDCVKAFDLQYWSVLRWDETGDVPLPRQVVWENEIHIRLPDTGTAQLSFVL